MSIFPTEDWIYLNRNREKISDWNKLKNTEIDEISIKIKEKINEKGPVSSKELDIKRKVDWLWAPANLGKAVLEALYIRGDLIVHRKEKKSKFYDLTYKHIDKKILNSKKPFKNIKDYHDWYLLRRINSIGFLWNKRSDAFLGIVDFKSKERNEAFVRLLKKGKICEFFIEGINGSFYISSDYLSQINSQREIKRVSFVAPLDNLIWDRNMTKELFNFDYVWEIYKPKSKRIYGYYVLPILYGSNFIGRIEPKRDKKKDSLIINNLWWEKNIKKTQKLKREFQETLLNFKEFNYLSNIEYSQNFLNSRDNQWVLNNG